MKITIHTLSGLKKDIILDDKANIRELRTAIEKHLGIPYGTYRLNVKTKNGEQISEIFNDDPADAQLSEFFKSYSKNPSLDIGEINVYLVYILCSSGLRGSQPIFFQPSGENTFSKRLALINFPEEKVPEEFCDSINETIMDNPQIAFDQRTYDLTTLKSMNYKSPYDRSILSNITTPNIKLQEEEEKFVAQAERECHLEREKKETKSHNPDLVTYNLSNNDHPTAIEIISIQMINDLLTVNFKVDKRVEHSIKKIILTEENHYPINESSVYSWHGSTNKPTDRHLNIDLNTHEFSFEKSVIAAVNISDRTIGISDLLTNHLSSKQLLKLLEKKLLESKPNEQKPNHVSSIQSSATLYGKKPMDVKSKQERHDNHHKCLIL